VSTHRNRAVVERFRLACERDDRVLAAFLGGSLAAGRDDDHSDLDLYLIAPEGKCTGLVEQAERFVATWGEPVFTDVPLDFERLGFDMVHFVLADGASGELAIAHRSNFRRTHGGPHRVLVDKAGILRDVEFPLLSRSGEELQRGAARALSWFWLHGIGLAKAMQRDRLWVAQAPLHRLRASLWELLLAAGLPSDEAARIEHEMTRSFVPFDRAEVNRAVVYLTQVYRTVAPRAASRLGVELPERLAQVAIARLTALEG
jgi:hypothetical protein